MNWILVFLGGGFGSITRFGISLIIKQLGWTFPLATLISNVAASFIIGVLTALTMKGILSDEQKMLWATGFCGGFSTFSTFSNETVYLFQNGNTLTAIFNITLSIFCCLLATFLGLKVV